MHMWCHRAAHAGVAQPQRCRTKLCRADPAGHAGRGLPNADVRRNRAWLLAGFRAGADRWFLWRLPASVEKRPIAKSFGEAHGHG